LACSLAGSLLLAGCPQLIDDQLEIVPIAEAGAPQTDGGAPAMQQDEPVTDQGDGGARAATPAKGGSPSCGTSLVPRVATCPPLCDRCDAGYCVFDCASEEACKERAIVCPPGVACRVQCAAKAACTKATIACPPEYDCDIECSQANACDQAKLSCSSGSCNVRCSFDNACEKLSVTCAGAQCGAECLDNSKPPELLCGPACACNRCD
jgi:hypothetical protein